MASRKLQQQVEKCFKKVAEGVEEFEAFYEKIEQSNNLAQKERLEDNLKREIKKLQRLRDQIRTWAASNDIKDKAPLLEHRKLIETQMEKFKAVDKAMKTKAYSKGGLSAAAKLDPKEQAKVECSEFLSNTVDELEQQIETLEAESESISATMKKGKSQAAKAERIAEIERIIKQHKWHQGKLELIRRSLENGGVEAEQVMELEESIKYYVTDSMNEDYIVDEGLYDELELEDAEGNYGMNVDNENSSLHDAQSKSPLPALATLHAPLSTISDGNNSGPAMKPAQVPTRPAGRASSMLPLRRLRQTRTTWESHRCRRRLDPRTRASCRYRRCSPRRVRQAHRCSPRPRNPPESKPAVAAPVPSESDALGSTSRPKESKAAGKQPAVPEPTEPPRGVFISTASTASDAKRVLPAAQTNGVANGIKPIEEEPEEESIYHLPVSLQDLFDSYETSKKRQPHPASQAAMRMMSSSQASCPDQADAECPRTYRPEVPVPPAVAAGFPREPLPIFDDPRLYSRIDPDTLFYVFYYEQGTAHQYLAARALKGQSWRFHKKYQTWFQRHGEPKNITDEFEQGAYRFFDYESTWYVITGTSLTKHLLTLGSR
ncbi:hypothetical protein MRS44_017501 [Fusarium solani]|uniref:uncharacterized protein n=1 Tax=Fusarium solani TaxID=169388 RepID=UPI0032C44CE0|nr:hypothetical protein MRS44_017501 [Fusarium solani]